MKKELQDIKTLLKQAEGSMQCAIDHFGKHSLMGNAYQHGQAKERKKAFIGALRKIDRLIKRSNDEQSK